MAEENGTFQQRYVSMAIQGDLTGAPAFFREAGADGEGVSALRDAFEARFFHAGDDTRRHTGTLEKEVARAFRTYWRKGLMGETELSLSQLEYDLVAILGRFGENRPERTDVFTSLGVMLRKNGIHFYHSAAPPLHDLFLWLAESNRRFAVQLGDGSLDLTVHFVDEVLLQGWKHYASLGLASTTGWVEGGELFCLARAYDTGSEAFKVSFLKHEARHLADLERYPRMDSTELEYRAKLTELAFANRSLKRILDDFTSKSAVNTKSPHAMANWRVIHDVYRELFGEEMPHGYVDWGAVRTGKVNRVSRELLKLNTALHDRAGAE